MVVAHDPGVYGSYVAGKAPEASLDMAAHHYIENSLTQNVIFDDILYLNKLTAMIRCLRRAALLFLHRVVPRDPIVGRASRLIGIRPNWP